MTDDAHGALAKAWKMAEDYNEGSVVIQFLKSGEFLVTHQMDQNSFPNLGAGWSDSENRIMARLDCRYYDKLYWEGEKQIEKNRLAPEDFQDSFYDLLEEIENNIIELQQEALS